MASNLTHALLETPMHPTSGKVMSQAQIDAFRHRVKGTLTSLIQRGAHRRPRQIMSMFEFVCHALNAMDGNDPMDLMSFIEPYFERWGKYAPDHFVKRVFREEMERYFSTTPGFSEYRRDFNAASTQPCVN